LDPNIANFNKTQKTRSLMKNRIAPWMAALVCAIAIHILIIEISDSQHWFDIDTQPSNFELFLLPAPATPNNEQTGADTFQQNEDTKPVENQSIDNQPVDAQPADTTLITEEAQTAASKAKNTKPVEKIEPKIPTESPTSIVPKKPTGKELSERSNGFDPQEVISNMDNEQALSGSPSQNGKQNSSLDSARLSSDKPELLDLSKVSLSPDVDDAALTGVFSEELRDKIAQSKKAQKDYLKGLTKEVDYPITKDADGTRYVNIKGVCWRLPKEGSNEGWAIVFDGCGVKSKLFHFELNISPSIITNEILGPDSPFNLDQPVK
jgi:hypothetical protein